MRRRPPSLLPPPASMRRLPPPASMRRGPLRSPAPAASSAGDLMLFWVRRAGPPVARAASAAMRSPETWPVLTTSPRYTHTLTPIAPTVVLAVAVP